MDTCTRCNGTGYIDLFTSKVSCGCQFGQEEKEPDGIVDSLKGLLSCETITHVPEGDLISCNTCVTITNMADDDGCHNITIPSSFETSVPSFSFAPLRSGVEVEVDGDEIKLLAGDITLLTESKQHWSNIAGLSTLPTEDEREEQTSFYPPKRATKTKLDIRLFNDDNGWHATLRGNLDLIADGETVHEVVQAVIEKSGLAIQSQIQDQSSEPASDSQE